MRRGGRCLVAATGLVVLAGILSAAALGDPGEPDRAFGEGGTVATGVPLGGPWSRANVQLAATPDGGSVVAVGSELVRYLQNGSLDPAFGEEGIRGVSIPGYAFDASDLAVDGQGRVVAIGTATRSGASRQPPPSFAAVVRFLPDGSLDPDFGDGGGHVVGRFGLGSGAPAPRVTATSGSVDSFGSTTFVVGTMARVARCGGPSHLERRDRLLVRLEPDGSLARFFGDHGTERIAPLTRVDAIAFSEGGEIALAGALAGRCGDGPESGVTVLRPEGARRPGYASGGTLRLTGTVAAVAVDARGRAVVLTREKQLPARDEHAWKVLRLLPDGELDPDFSGGRLVYTAQGPSYLWTDIAIDSRERPLLVGTLVKRLSPTAAGPRFHRWLMVVPLRQDGKLRGGMGWRGWIAITRLDPHSEAAASEALLQGDDRLLIAGAVRRPDTGPSGAVALVRLEL